MEHTSLGGLERAKADSPDVCLLDIGLPEMDGNELARRLRSDPATANSLLIAVSGYGAESERERGMAARFDHYLVKPLDTNRLALLLTKVE